MSDRDTISVLIGIVLYVIADMIDARYRKGRAELDRLFRRLRGHK